MPDELLPSDPVIPTLSFLQYDRTVIAYHGTTRELANRLVNGDVFEASDTEDEWLGTGIYFWEHAPKQAWHWATQTRKYPNPAVVGAVLRLGNCFDMCDPGNIVLLHAFRDDLVAGLKDAGQPIPKNYRRFMKLDCAVFNRVYNASTDGGHPIDSFRAVYVPTDKQKRIWKGSWIYAETHVQISIRNASKILAVWHVRKDGRYGIDP
ncbi:MAG: hypothetical protein JWN40_5266 [Phycisphaerales bacterium]|nr:hypothetical protein [Phycisphaerales bacterium]